MFIFILYVLSDYGYTILLNAQTNSSSGKVYIQTGGQLGFLCSDDFTQADADVVCREVGYPGATFYQFMS